MKINLQNNWTKRSGILIIGVCFSAILIGRFIEYYYRGTWIYQYGGPILLLVFYGGGFLSLLNTIFLISKHKFDIKNNLLWIILSAIPFLYIAIVMTIAMIRTIE